MLNVILPFFGHALELRDRPNFFARMAVSARERIKKCQEEVVTSV